MGAFIRDRYDLRPVSGVPVPLPVYKTRLLETKQKLEGQPEFFGNLAVGYDIGGFSGRVSVFYQGEYNRSYSAGRRNDPVVVPFYSAGTFRSASGLTQNISIFFSLNNFTSVRKTSIPRIVSATGRC